MIYRPVIKRIIPFSREGKTLYPLYTERISPYAPGRYRFDGMVFDPSAPLQKGEMLGNPDEFIEGAFSINDVHHSNIYKIGV